MRAVTDGDVRWIREGTIVAPTLASAIPPGFAVYGVLDLGDQEVGADLALLGAVADVEDELIAGRLLRGLWTEGEPGDEHKLYQGWRYRLRRRTAEDLRVQLAADPDPWRFPELLLPADRAWLVSTLWDDSWRSIGTSEAGARAIEAVLPAFERIGRNVDLTTTGREIL